ncbi:hypothetical protein WT92_06885 [Burkholderia stagnalis]|uniref:Uncharacterized protein n=1 Tax=Burkholderia stagnalis TaxID=1503054 RepID=A0A119GZY4_9BURK|nr:hypothetical protein WS59_29715 [Burkholderia stagnalis]KVN16085.1 hypothetical protein WT10_22305 [Burkholderia stagnalis]KVZ02361.1 hypothetical protein WT35_30045 [Burkholderia stagnalis]KWA58585.1 hypothetical protein WT44_20640 [Burkholderia stagnalis]KWC97348.1 hypothetical protein WT46_24725 [Burkholderia stagnalis]
MIFRRVHEMTTRTLCGARFSIGWRLMRRWEGSMISKCMHGGVVNDKQNFEQVISNDQFYAWRIAA